MKKSLALMIVAILMVFGTNISAADPSVQDETMVIKNSNGEYLGTVKNLLIDPSGNIVFVILSQDQGAQGLSRKDIAVPVGAFSYDHDQNQVVLDITKEQLNAAPEFTAAALEDPLFPQRVFRFFGQAPFWSNGKPHEAPGGDRIE